MNPRSFFAELKRRNVYRVAVAYGVVAWLLIQIATQVFPFFDIPNWAVRLVVLLIAVGFPIALILAWAFELTPEGIKRTEEVAPNQSITRKTGRKLDFLIFAVLLLVIGALVYQQLRPKRSATAASTSVAIPEKSIAVLPFENLSANQENAFFTDGVQDEILTNLAKIADLKVISRTSVMLYKSGNPRNLREIGQQLGVAHVLEGSVQRAANRVRVNAQLIDARSDAHLWAQTYDRDLADVFAIQSEIAKTIADQLQAKLSPKEKAAIEEQPTTDLRAYECYIKGKELLSGFVGAADPQGTVTRAVQLLQEATERDSHFLLAYYKLAEAHENAYSFQVDHTPARLAQAKEAVDAAIRLRPDAPETHLAQAWYAYIAAHDYNRARDEVAKALNALPNNADALTMAARIDRRQGRWDDSLHNYLRAKEVDPGSTEILRDIAAIYVSMRRYSDSERFVIDTLGKLPEAAGLYHYQLGVCYLAEGKLERAKTTFAQMPASYDPFGYGTMNKVITALYLRDYDSATQFLAAGPPVLPDSPADRSRCPRSWFEAQITRARRGAVESQATFTAVRGEVVALWHDTLEEPSHLTLLARIDAALGRKAEALREARRAVELRPISEDALEGPRHVINLALVYAWLGERNAALEQLERLVTINGGPSYGDLRFNPQWDDLRGDPRFAKIVESLAPKETGK
jgi:TolB-like protein